MSSFLSRIARPCRLALATLLFPLSLAASAQAPAVALEGEYSMVSSTTTPASSNWGYTKGHISIRKLDERHLMIAISCEWKREPKAICGEHYFAQWQEGGLFLQDMNTDLLRVYFEPSTRTLTLIARGLDAKGSVRRELYKPATQELTDPALVRRLKREVNNAQHPENLRVFGHHSKWAYSQNKVEMQTK